jgi:ankyrin repeat protein/acyl-CoA-binding protein
MTRNSKSMLMATAMVTMTAMVATSVYWNRRRQQRNKDDNQSSSKELASEEDDGNAIPLPLKQRFEASCQHIQTTANPRLTQAQQLQLYGWYKQAILGDATTTGFSPSWNVVAKAKYNAWKANHGMPRAAAMQAYIDFVVYYEFTKEVANDQNDQADIIYNDDEDEADSSDNIMDVGGMGFKPSTLNHDDVGLGASETDEQGNDKYPLHKAARENNLPKLKELLLQQQEESNLILNVNALDDSGQTALHLAADQGHASIVQALIAAGSNVLAADQDGFAPLHVAVIASQFKVCQILLRYGADPLQKDADGDTALSSCEGSSDDQGNEIYTLLMEHVNKKKKNEQQNNPNDEMERATSTNVVDQNTKTAPTTVETNSSATTAPSAFSLFGKQPDLSMLDSIPLDDLDDGDGDM